MARRTFMTGTTLPDTAAESQAAMPVQRQRAVHNLGATSQRSGQVSDDTAQRPLRNDPRLPAFLISTIFHTLLLILLALFTRHNPAARPNSLTARQGSSESVLSLPMVSVNRERALESDAPAEQPINVTIAPNKPPEIMAPMPTTDVADQKFDGLAAAGGVPSIDTLSQRLPHGGLDGRTAKGRLEYGKKYGATIESEQAVDAALAWLAQHQRPDGSWSFNLELDPCEGRCRHSKLEGSDSPTPSTAATGLALLAFLGAGHPHHDKGPYQENVRRGIYYLRAVAAEAQAGYDWQQGSMYGHGIAVMALSEALAMTSRGDRRDSDLYDLVARGASFTCVAQHRNGSWGYVPGRPGDTTVTGWQVLSLIAAKRSRVPLHTNTLRDAKAFVMSTCTDRDYWFGYKGPPGEPTTTAIGLTLMLYLGESPAYTPFYYALTEMAERGPTLTNIYHDYYATLALHHSRHRDWDLWNAKLRDHLVATQAQSGHEKGSWHFSDRWGDVGGRLYTTAMCAMTLEIYYRYQPLYETIEQFPL